MEHHVEPMHDLDQQPHHLRTGKSGRKKGINKKLLIIAGAVIGVAVLAAGAFFMFKKDTKSDQAGKNQQSQEQKEEDENESTMPPAEAAQPQTYKSETLNIEITHRKDWTLVEDAEKKLLVVTSPKFTYQTSSGESKKGVFTVRIGFGATEAVQANIDESKAVRDSLLIGYDAPTESQRYYTNISYAGPDESAFKFFVVTGSLALKLGASLSGAVIVNSSDFLIAGGFGEDSKRSLSYDSVPPAELEQYSAFEQALAIVKSLKVY